MAIEYESGERTGSINLKEIITQEFIGNNTELHSPIHLRNTITRQPFFVVAGVQILDPVIHQEAEIPSNRQLVFQPSVRLKFSDRVSFDPPITTSFVNIASVAVNKGEEEHMEETRKWIEFLKDLGVPNLSTRDRVVVNNWGTGEFKNQVVDVFSDDVHIGDSVYRFSIPQATKFLDVSDISFGYERLACQLAPINNLSKKEGSQRDQDLVRTLTLLIGDGIVPSPKSNIGRIVRNLTGNITDTSFLYELVYYYHEWWKKFMPNLWSKPHQIAEAILDSKFT